MVRKNFMQYYYVNLSYMYIAYVGIFIQLRCSTQPSLCLSYLTCGIPINHPFISYPSCHIVPYPVHTLSCLHPWHLVHRLCSSFLVAILSQQLSLSFVCRCVLVNHLVLPYSFEWTVLIPSPSALSLDTLCTESINILDLTTVWRQLSKQLNYPNTLPQFLLTCVH